MHEPKDHRTEQGPQGGEGRSPAGQYRWGATATCHSHSLSSSAVKNLLGSLSPAVWIRLLSVAKPVPLHHKTPSLSQQAGSEAPCKTRSSYDNLCNFLVQSVLCSASLPTGP